MFTNKKPSCRYAGRQ